MSQSDLIKRLHAIKQSPITWKELDSITAVEQYLHDALDLPIIRYALPCFPIVDQRLLARLEIVWQFSLAAFQLNKTTLISGGHTPQLLLRKAERIYEQEAQRILGSIFPWTHPFWKAFYKRQESHLKKPLVVVDGLYFLSNRSERINYVILVQCLKAILQQNYVLALQLITNLPLEDLKSWITKHQTNS